MTVFLDKNIYAPAGDYLAEHAEVMTDFEHPEKLDAIICRARPITRELIEQCPNLKAVGDQEGHMARCILSGGECK